MLEDAGLIDEPQEGMPSGLDRRAAVLCFLWSSPFVTDEVKRRDKMMHLNFTDFIEALCRVCTFKPLPTTELLKTHGARSCAHFFQQETQGLHDGRKLCGRAVDWREKEVSANTSSNAMRQPLEMLISLIFERLSATGDMLTRQELKGRLIARADAKREAAEAKRAAEEAEKAPAFFHSITSEFVGATKRADMS